MLLWYYRTWNNNVKATTKLETRLQVLYYRSINLWKSRFKVPAHVNSISIGVYKAENLQEKLVTLPFYSKISRGEFLVLSGKERTDHGAGDSWSIWELDYYFAVE